MFTNFSFDRISFWIGVIVASLLWWMMGKLRAQLPRLKEALKQQAEEARHQNLRTVEETLCQETLRLAQHSHLGAAMFPLDDVLIAPRLLPAYCNPDPEGPPQLDTIVDKIIPITPDWPEIASYYKLPTLTLAEAIQNKSNIAILGQPGSGKSVALAAFASQMARLRLEGAQNVTIYTPLLIHAFDLDPALPAGQDPLNNLNKAAANQVSAILKTQMPGLIKEGIKDGTLVLLLDGLDEVPPEELARYSAYLGALLGRHPRLRCILAALPDYLDGLVALGFVPMALAGWDHVERRLFAQRWGQAFTSRILPEVRKQKIEVSDLPPAIFTNWVTFEFQHLSPLEWTLKIWAAYAGDVFGPSTIDAIRSYLLRASRNQVPIAVLEKLAHEMIRQNQVSMAYSAMEKFLTRNTKTSAAQTAEPAAANADAAPAETPDAKGKREKQLSSGAKIIDILLQTGLMIEHNNERIRFVNPLITAYLAGMGYDEAEPADLISQPLWTIKGFVLRYVAAQNKAAPILSKLLEKEDHPLQSELLWAARCLSNAPRNAQWKTPLMGQIVNVLQNEAIPLAVRSRMICACVAANDPAVAQLFRQLLLAESPTIRQLSALGCGAIQDVKAIPDLKGMLNDPEANVRHAACMALAAIGNATATQCVVEALMLGDEGLRQTAAETLAFDPLEGQTILREGITSDDLLVRRAIVFGLAMVRTPWAIEMLEKITVEDGQWVVRNAAGQVLEYLQRPNAYIPTPLTPASETSWVIKFASKQGVGVAAGKPATQILLQALRFGEPEEKIAAIAYLQRESDDGIVGALYEFAYGEQNLVSEAAAYAIWMLATSGANMPSPKQYGLG